MNKPDDENQTSFRSAVTLTVIGTAVITFVILFVAIFAGRFLDKMLHSSPWITIIMVLVSIPITIVLMFRLVKVATSQIKPVKPKPTDEVTHRGTDE